MAPTEWAPGSCSMHWKLNSQIPEGRDIQLQWWWLSSKVSLSTNWTSCAFYAIWKYGALEMSCWPVLILMIVGGANQHNLQQTLQYLFLFKWHSSRFWKYKVMKYLLCNLEPWSMLHLRISSKNLNCSETVKTKLFFQICSCFRYYILWIWQNTTQTSTCPACANTAASVPSDLMTWRPALTVTTSFRPYHVHTTITHHTSFILVSHQSQTSPKCNEIILWKLQILSQLTAILITINNSLSRIVRLDAEILQLGH